MRPKRLVPSVLVVLALVGCSGEAGSDGDSGPAEAEILKRLAESDPWPKRSVVSRDGSLSTVVPEQWDRVPDILSESLLTLSTGPVTSAVINPCQPGAVLEELPKGGALVRIWETLRPTRRSVGGGYPPRPKRFRLGRRQSAECGALYELRFELSGRNLNVSIWAGADSGGEPGGPAKSSRSLSPRVRVEILEMLDRLRADSAMEMPIRNPTLALDCRTPPNTLECDRVWVHLLTRIGMRQVSARINRWSARTPEGWLYGDRVISLPTRLKTSASRHLPVPVSAALSRTVWGGAIPSAGLGSSGDAFERSLPGPGGKWIGTNPEIRADLEIISPRGRWSFRDVRLIAGHG